MPNSDAPRSRRQNANANHANRADSPHSRDSRLQRGAIPESESCDGATISQRAGTTEIMFSVGGSVAASRSPGITEMTPFCGTTYTVARSHESLRNWIVTDESAFTTSRVALARRPRASQTALTSADSHMANDPVARRRARYWVALAAPVLLLVAALVP